MHDYDWADEVKFIVDKSTWPDGPWKNEPDWIKWRYADVCPYTMQITRNALGSLCGYVGVPEGHPLHGVRYGDTPGRVRYSCHGGLTFSGPLLGEDQSIWWFGFDCAHGGDLSPGRYPDNTFFSGNAGYRIVEYVKCEVTSLALELAHVGK